MKSADLRSALFMIIQKSPAHGAEQKVPAELVFVQIEATLDCSASGTC